MANKPSSKLKQNASRPGIKNVKNFGLKTNRLWPVVIRAPNRLTAKPNKYTIQRTA